MLSGQSLPNAMQRPAVHSSPVCPLQMLVSLAMPMYRVQLLADDLSSYSLQSRHVQSVEARARRRPCRSSSPAEHHLLLAYFPCVGYLGKVPVGPGCYASGDDQSVAYSRSGQTRSIRQGEASSVVYSQYPCAYLLKRSIISKDYSRDNFYRNTTLPGRYRFTESRDTNHLPMVRGLWSRSCI